jgi:hypothetical protein
MTSDRSSRPRKPMAQVDDAKRKTIEARLAQLSQLKSRKEQDADALNREGVLYISAMSHALTQKGYWSSMERSSRAWEREEHIRESIQRIEEEMVDLRLQLEPADTPDAVARHRQAIEAKIAYRVQLKSKKEEDEKSLQREYLSVLKKITDPGAFLLTEKEHGKAMVDSSRVSDKLDRVRQSVERIDREIAQLRKELARTAEKRT